MAKVADKNSDVFSDRDEKFMRAFLDLAVKWADERPEAAPTGLSIMGTSMLAVAINGPELETRSDEAVEVSAQATELLSQERPHDALDEVLSAISSLDQTQSNDRSSDNGGSDTDASDEGSNAERPAN